MAYLAFAETAGGASAPIPFFTQAPAPAAPAASFSALEWSVVALAERDRVSSLRTPGAMAVALGALFGERPNPRLADERLEALRRMAVLSWHHGYTVPSREIAAFVGAGFTLDHYELLVDSIGVARARRNRKYVA